MEQKILLMFFSVIASAACYAYSRDSYEVIYPERIHKTRSKRDLSTVLSKDHHEEYVTFSIPTSTKDYIVDLRKNAEIHTGSIMLRTFNDEGEAVHTKHKPENCYYHGSIRGIEHSYVFISTCSGGLTGSFDDGKNRHDIEPHNDEGGHKFYNVDRELAEIHAKLKKKSFCGSRSKSEDESSKHHRSRRSASTPRPFGLINVEPQYIKYLTTNSTRYVEMFVSADHGLYTMYNKDKDLILERVLNALSQVDKSYSAINVRLVLVALEIQSNGPTFTRFKTGGADLTSFRNYINDVIKKTSAFKDIRIDNGALLSHYYWSDCAGMAYVGTVCTSSSAAVDAWSQSSISGPTVVIGHEFGHNMNFPHDGPDCICLTPRGCFMGGSKSSRPGFSDCNMRRLASKTFACINDYPIAPLSSRCGNGIKEADEECDCGTPENCARNEPCCEPHNCKLKAHAQCSFINNPECCSTQCLFKKQGTLCREPKGNCDLPEYCVGDKATCPADVVSRNGLHCGDSIKMLIGTYSRHRATTTALSPHVFARYLKIIPKHWTKGGKACLKLEVVGCEISSGASTLATPISTIGLYYHGPMCITPNITTCNGNIPDGTKIIYKSMPNNDCDHPHMLFTFGSDGTLTHQCTGKKVCPSNDGQYLIISSACASDEAKYTRTQLLSLKQVTSGKCVNSKDGWPQSNDPAKLTSSCDDTRYFRTKLEFFQTDCKLPFGISNGKLLDSAFSAGSKQSETYNAQNVRMSKNAWCPASKTDGSWFMVDFGRIVEVSEMIIKGTYYNWITGYHLMYSEDKVQWHAYKESHATSWKDMNSFCYNGECAKTYTNQCHELWNTDAKKASDQCWNELNVNVNGFGTCNPTKNVSCTQSNAQCGQLQCESSQSTPYYVNYGTQYKEIMIDSKKCSGAAITKSEQAGLGMVDDGTKCDSDKFCVSQQCKTANDHGVTTCAIVHGVECNGKGTCGSNGVCHCTGTYSPADGCKTKFVAVDGGWSSWSSFTPCNKGCNGGTQTRLRFCKQPYPKHGGADCDGNRLQTVTCNTQACPVGRTCKAIKLLLAKDNKPLLDGVYTIQPKPELTLKAYCDLNRDGGGWTLIVSSHTNSWIADNVRLRHEDTPELLKDYSILQYANTLKKSYLIKEPKFQYRLEANTLGYWGGIWEAPSTYDMSSTNANQKDVKLLQKFSDWTYSSSGIEERLPYIYEHRLTTSGSPSSNHWGSITDNKPGYHPSRWISGDLKMGYPEHVWYWMRENDYDYPKSCAEIMFRGFGEVQNYKSGVYKIEPKPEQIVSTYCDFDRHGGGWTLITKVSAKSGWDKKTVLSRNSNNAASKDFSIFGLIDDIKYTDAGEVSFDYMIEADGNGQNGGIFSLPVTFTLLTHTTSQVKPTLLKKFGTWDEATENIAKYPVYASSKSGIFLTASSDSSTDTLGTVVSSSASGPTYMKSHPKPSVVRLWVRAGGSRRSCNDLRIHGHHKGKANYQNGFYMMKGLEPMYCDMTTTDKEAYTLLVTAATNGWSMAQTLSRNTMQPNVYKDYSILSKANSIKSLSNGNQFKYMIDAQKRNSWGGIWKAPIEYSFTSTSNSNRDVTLLKKFNEWDYEVVWWRGPKKRMPYLGRESKNKALLTTADYDDYTEWGSIVSSGSEGKDPSKWIYPQMQSPGVIWYWVNENDCDSNYKQIDGKFSPWSLWSVCSTFCGSGKQSRARSCTNPKPRCGGIPCDANMQMKEERVCSGTCPETLITTPDDGYCFEPQSGGCSPADGTVIVLRPASTHCKAAESKFNFNPDTGTMRHQCSGKSVCPSGGNSGYSTRVVVSSTCPAPSTAKHLLRTLWGSIQFNTLCLDPYGGRIRDNVQVALWRGCLSAKRQFKLPGVAAGPVHASYFSNVGGSLTNLTSDKRFPNMPTKAGYIDNFDSHYNIGDSYGMRLWSYFMAPQTGKYTFIATCDDSCTVYLSTNTEKSNKSTIITTTWASRYQWTKTSSQKSQEIELAVGRKYYLEALLLENTGSDHVSVGVYLPDGSSVLPITGHYLSSTAA